MGVNREYRQDTSLAGSFFTMGFQGNLILLLLRDICSGRRFLLEVCVAYILRGELFLLVVNVVDVGCVFLFISLGFHPPFSNLRALSLSLHIKVRRWLGGRRRRREGKTTCNCVVFLFILCHPRSMGGERR